MTHYFMQEPISVARWGCWSSQPGLEFSQFPSALCKKNLPKLYAEWGRHICPFNTFWLIRYLQSTLKSLDDLARTLGSFISVRQKHHSYFTWNSY